MDPELQQLKQELEAIRATLRDMKLPVAHLIVFQVTATAREFIYDEFAARIKEAVPSSIRLTNNLFLVADSEQLNARSRWVCGRVDELQ